MYTMYSNSTYPKLIGTLRKGETRSLYSLTDKPLGRFRFHGAAEPYYLSPLS
jgi:hypothetical protein